jgi:two-component system NarL family sensor kinase
MRRSTTSIAGRPISLPTWRPDYLAWSLATLSIILVIATFISAIRFGILTDNFRVFLSHQALTPFLTIAFTLVGALIASRVPGNPIGWIFLSVGILYTLTGLAVVIQIYGPLAVEGNIFPSYDLVTWFTNWLWMPAFFLPITLVLLYFPDGSLLSSRWRFVSWSASLGITLSVLVVMLHPGPLDYWDLDSNPLGIPSAVPYLDMVANLGFLLLGVGFIGSVAAFLVRFRRSRGIEREQMKWLVYALGLLGVIFLCVLIFTFIFPEGTLVADLSITLTNLTILGIAIAAAIAILRYNLYDIDVIINRTLVYGALTSGVIGIYVLVVGAVGVLFQQSSNLLVSLLATGLAALLVQPLRERLQRAVNRLMYGERDDPYALLSGLDRRLEESLSPQTSLPIVVETIAQALKLPYVAVELYNQDGYRLAASYGLSPTQRDQHIALPLVYQNERIGRLVLSPRSAGETFHPAEIDLLTDIARHVGAAANAVLLTENLQHSREGIVTAREEERRRLSRDLHDGLGPQLVSLGFKVEAAQNLLTQDPGAVGNLLSQLKVQIKAALGDVRRIAYDLRPPALDQLGLLPAIQEHVNSLKSPAGLTITLDAPPELPDLPAAIEVAAYRIILEAVTNVVQHAHANRAAVQFKVNHGLEIEISDDGRGLPAINSPGVGISSMRERAAELGGTCTIITRQDGGTRVLVKIPLHLTEQIGGEGG